MRCVRKVGLRAPWFTTPRCRRTPASFLSDLAGMDLWRLSGVRPARRRLFPGRLDSVVRDLHRALERSRSNLQWSQRESGRDQDEVRKHSSAWRVVWNDRCRQVGHYRGSVGPDWTPVRIPVDRRRRVVACGAYADPRLRAGDHQSERSLCDGESLRAAIFSDLSALNAKAK
jgi:hypothetical protein